MHITQTTLTDAGDICAIFRATLPCGEQVIHGEKGPVSYEFLGTDGFDAATGLVHLDARNHSLAVVTLPSGAMFSSQDRGFGLAFHPPAWAPEARASLAPRMGWAEVIEGEAGLTGCLGHIGLHGTPAVPTVVAPHQGIQPDGSTTLDVYFEGSSGPRSHYIDIRHYTIEADSQGRINQAYRVEPQDYYTNEWRSGELVHHEVPATHIPVTCTPGPNGTVTIVDGNKKESAAWLLDPQFIVKHEC